MTTRQAVVHARRPTSSSTTATSASCRPRRRSRAALQRASPAASRSRARSATASLLNTRTGDDLNDLNNLGLRGQLLYRAVRPPGGHAGRRSHAPAARRATRRSSPASRRRCARPTASTPQIAADLGYTPPSFNAFDRLTDVDTPLRSYQDLGGDVAQRRLEARAAAALTSTTALPATGTGTRRTTATSSACRSPRSRRRRPTSAVDAGGALRRRIFAAPELRRRRVLLPPGPRLRPVVQAGAGLRGRALPAGADRRRGRRRACSTATASTSS